MKHLQILDEALTNFRWSTYKFWMKHLQILDEELRNIRWSTFKFWMKHLQILDEALTNFRWSTCHIPRDRLSCLPQVEYRENTFHIVCHYLFTGTACQPCSTLCKLISSLGILVEFTVNDYALVHSRLKNLHAALIRSSPWRSPLPFLSSALMSVLGDNERRKTPETQWRCPNIRQIKICPFF